MPRPPSPSPNLSESLKVASWNLQIFGQTKANNSQLMNQYVKTIQDYDLIFIQEIRDSSGEAFPKLCAMLLNYSCEISSRAGRTVSKEQYGVIYKKQIKLNFLKDYNPDPQDRWERPPLEVSFDLGTYNLTLINIHIKPQEVKEELDYLEDLIPNQGNTAVLGDLNADCAYYNPKTSQAFDTWIWLIQDNQDTTVGSSDCAYDRIFVTPTLNQKVFAKGIDTRVTPEESDHYLIWFQVQT